MSYRIPNTEIFLVDLNERAAICYSPLKGDICLIDAESAQKFRTLNPSLYDADMREFISDMDAGECVPSVPVIGKINKLSIIPGSRCNLSCSYCYSALGRSNATLGVEQVDAALNWYVDPQRIDGDFLSIFITGGGEPLASWDVTSHIIQHARALASRRGLRLHISVITNGTLITDNKIRLLKENECSVGVSFDVVEDVQNANRGRFDVVKRNIKSLLAAGLRVMINSTIIPSSVGRMVEAVDEVIAQYPGLAQFTMEPATGTDIFGSPEAMRSFYDDFLREYFLAKAKAQQSGLNLRFTFDDSLRGVTTRHCPGKFALTPSGKISICHLVSSPLEKRFDDCTYGLVTPDGVEIDTAKFQQLYACNLFAYPECADCIAKWSCGGECFTRRSTYPPEYLAEVCRFNRNVVERLLRKEVEDVQLS